MEIIETNLDFDYMSERNSTERTILHHAEASVCSAEDIHRWHKQKGWSGAGYHFLVRKDGSIYRMRPEDKVGAHAYGSNYNSIGICAEGKYQEETMPEVQKNSIVELCKYLCNKYSISTIQKHSDVCATSCPGSMYPFEEIKQAIFDNKEVEQQITPVEDKNSNMGIVATIQSTLNQRYGLNIAVDNIYGNETKKALVKALQKIIGVTADGIFGPVTKSHCPNIRKGNTGTIVTLIQSILVCHGFDISVDGDFGDETDKAVRAFQARNNLTVDGIVGKNTFNCLFK